MLFRTEGSRRRRITILSEQPRHQQHHHRRRRRQAAVIAAASTATATATEAIEKAKGTMEYDELLTLVINCFDGRSSDGGIAHFDILYEFMCIEKGKQQFQNMYKDQQMLAAYAVALLRTTGNSNCIDFVTFDFKEALLSLCLKPCYKDLLVNYLNGTMSFKEYCSNNGNNNNTIVQEWFDEREINVKSNRKKRQQNEIRTNLLYILISLLGTNKSDLTALAKKWDGKKYAFALNNKMKLKKYMLQFVPAATTATTPRRLLSKHSRTPRKNDGTTTPFFSPSMTSPLGKKQRSMTVSPLKSNRTFLQKLFSPGKNDRNKDEHHDHDSSNNSINNDNSSNNNNNITNHVIVETVHEENEEDIETIYNCDKHLTVDTSFGDGGGDDDDDDDDGEFRIRSTIQDGPNRVTPIDWSSPTKKTTTTPTTTTDAAASAYEAALAAAIHNVDDYGDEQDALNEINATTFYPSPKCKTPKKKLGTFKNHQKYPTLINGCDTYDDVPKALEEGFNLLGWSSIWESLQQNGKIAPVMIIKSKNGRHKKYVYVPVSSTHELLLRNARNKGWIEQIMEVAGSGDLDEEKVAIAIVVYLIKHHPKTLEAVAKELKIPQLMVNGRMDTHTAAAMWSEANVTVRGQAVINRYVSNVFGFRLSNAADIRKLTDHHVKPIQMKSKVGKQTITWWYKNIDEVVLNLLNNEWIGIDFDDIDVVFGGDHGAGVFGAAVKVIAWKGNEITVSAVEKVAHVDSEKDSYDILKKTCAPVLNEGLHRLKNQQLCINKMPFDDEDDNNENNNEKFASFVSLFDIDDGSSGNDISYHRIRVLGVGDLKFISMAQGKPDMDPHWCVKCDLAKNEFKKINCRKGICWTLEQMNEVRKHCDTLFNNNEVPKAQIPAMRKGCVKPPLFDAIEPHEWIIPVLHVMMGAFNAAFKGFFDYVEQRHEDITAKEGELRRKYWESLNGLDDVTATLEELKAVEVSLSLPIIIISLSVPNRFIRSCFVPFYLFDSIQSFVFRSVHSFDSIRFDSVRDTNPIRYSFRFLR